MCFSNRFDCVFPTRTARFGAALVDEGSLRLKAKQHKDEVIPIEAHCQCPTCRHYSRAYLHALLKDNDALASQLVTTHNVTYMMRLMRIMRDAILAGEDAYHKYINDFLWKQFPSGCVPSWALDALSHAGVATDAAFTRDCSSCRADGAIDRSVEDN